MRAVIATRAGDPDVLQYVEDLQDPQPGPDQVRISVKVAAITFIDTQRRAGRSPGPNPAFPIVLGNGVGGTVDRTGIGVDRSWIGSHVVSTTGGHGGYADLALAHVDDLHRIPTSLTVAEATAVLADGRTAVALHQAADIRAHETVVVTAAAGGVGGILLQMAASAGANVVALAGSESKLAHAQHLGAHVAIDYRVPGWTDALRSAVPLGAEVVFDGVGGSTTSALIPLVRDRGRFITHGAASGVWGSIDPDAADSGRIVIIPLSAIAGSREKLFEFTEHALTLAALGDIRVTIGQTFPLHQAHRAHAAIEARATLGKTLLVV